MATVPAHVSNATAFTKQKLLETIHNKQYEENQIENNAVMTEALKAVIEVREQIIPFIIMTYPS